MQVNESATSVSSYAIDVEVNQGYRGHNEDTLIAMDGLPQDPTRGLFVVMDGHGGTKTSEFLAANFG
jgi:serine/threonine protein phosphatase PrpC